MSKVSMTQIAEKLGVSKSLVSLALSNKYGVNDQTRFKIYIEAIKMGFDFQTIRSLNEKNEKYMISIYIKQIDLITERFWPEILSGIEKSLSRMNYRMKTHVWDNNDSEDELLVSVAQGGSDGVIIISELPKNVLIGLKKMNVPTVIVDSKEYYDGLFDNVRVNNYLGGYLVAEYLTKMGHKKLGFVGSIYHSVSFRERYQGFMDYFQNNSIIVDVKKAISKAKNSPENDFLFVTEDLSFMLEEDHPTAIFCANDVIAAMVYDKINQLGYRIPEDISVIGFDNVYVTNAYKPRLTSVNINKKEVGEQAVKLILNRINFPEKITQSILLGVEIDEKKSVYDLNKTGIDE